MIRLFASDFSDLQPMVMPATRAIRKLIAKIYAWMFIITFCFHVLVIQGQADLERGSSNQCFDLALIEEYVYVWIAPDLVT